MLQVKNLKKSFDQQVIWEDLNCTIDVGEIVSIQGRSGEGKTTFLRCLNGLETIDDGEILLDGKPIANMSLGREEKLGMVFQGYQLFPHLTVWDNLTLAPKYHNMDPVEMESRAKKLLSTLDLSDHAKKYPSQLSGGQKQRVAIARACMLNPEILCFDEPTSALDEATRDHIMEIIKQLADSGMTILIVTHDRYFAEQISDRILHIEGGRFREQKVS